MESPIQTQHKKSIRAMDRKQKRRRTKYRNFSSDCKDDSNKCANENNECFDDQLRRKNQHRTPNATEEEKEPGVDERLPTDHGRHNMVENLRNIDQEKAGIGWFHAWKVII